MALRTDFFEECTPGYYNSEGKTSKFGAKNATYAGGSPAFLKMLTYWREKGNLAGLGVRYFPKVKDKKVRTRNLTSRYDDLQEKEQAEIFDLLKRQKDKMAKLLRKSAEAKSV
ncbi:uncharacterized protein BDR25DRAFT_319079 [Lindgomyces ingoldianus]|uniref:Uncharacterized protein n=1 Tax=Lindgomyces ingoldianus TaxID=673940 RepID=A0ACB6QCB6_9PLEO|nr:uncharacterized protein BDR25DRAFT_319079 [Lindgomyces ingoldianus]KAF2464552.1 hypothetical protein BDR25DRAFT_319079 [Lindgomyces ingoldianus]